jgi:outer membrane protein
VFPHRRAPPDHGFETVWKGLARDGGVHRPETYPLSAVAFPVRSAPRRSTGARRAAILALLTAAAVPAHATTLEEALRAAYTTNPTLDAQRADLRATDEQAAIARAGGRPQAQVQASYTRGLNGLRDLEGYNQALIAGVSASLPLYQGGRVRNAIRAADLRSDAGRAQLRATEGDTFLDVVGAYLDVLRDREIVALGRENVATLERYRQAGETRLKLGDITRTDVAQTQARIEIGTSGLVNGEGNLVGSEQTYRNVVGLDPVALTPPAPPPLPASADEAVAIALRTNAALQALDKAAQAATRDVAAAEGARLPIVSLGAATNYYDYRDRFAGIGDVRSDASQVGATVTLPLYQGGVVSAQIRQARDRVDEAIDRRAAAERQVEAGTRAAYSSWQSAVRSIAAYERAVAANGDAARGVDVEAKGGERQVLDVLNAQLELLDSRIGLARARHDATLAAYQLLNTMGMADAAHLGLAAGGYDPMVNYRRAIHAFGDYAGRPSRARMGYGPPAEPAATSR